MEATPAVYHADIAHTHAHIARIDAEVAAFAAEASPQELPVLAPHWYAYQMGQRARLVRQVENLEHDLARAERLWAQAQAQGAGTRLP